MCYCFYRLSIYYLIFLSSIQVITIYYFIFLCSFCEHIKNYLVLLVPVAVVWWASFLHVLYRHRAENEKIRAKVQMTFTNAYFFSLDDRVCWLGDTTRETSFFLFYFLPFLLLMLPFLSEVRKDSYRTKYELEWRNRMGCQLRVNLISFLSYFIITHAVEVKVVVVLLVLEDKRKGTIEL